VIPILEWTQVSVALGDFVALCLIRRWVSGFSWFGVLLVMVIRMNVLMCFRADILLEIPRVHVSRLVGPSE